MPSAPEIGTNKLCKINNKNIEDTSKNKLGTPKNQPKTDVIHPDKRKLHRAKSNRLSNEKQMRITINRQGNDKNRRRQTSRNRDKGLISAAAK